MHMFSHTHASLYMDEPLLSPPALTPPKTTSSRILPGSGCVHTSTKCEGSIVRVTDRGLETVSMKRGWNGDVIPLQTHHTAD